MIRRSYGNSPLHWATVLLAITIIVFFAAIADARSGGRSGGGRSFSAPSRSFGGGGWRSFSAPSRSFGGSRSFSAPSRSFSSPGRSSGFSRSFSGGSISRAPSRDFSMRAPSGDSRSSAPIRPPADFRPSEPRMGNDFSRRGGDAFSAPRRSTGGSFSSPRRSFSDTPRTRDFADGGRRVGRSMSPQDLGISRPDSPSRRADMGSFGRSSRSTGDISRSDIGSRSGRSARGSESVSRQIARPDLADRSGIAGRGPEISQRSRGDSISRADRGSSISRSIDGERSRSSLRGGSDVARQIARPTDRGPMSTRRGTDVARRGDTDITRSDPSDRSRPVWRDGDSIRRQISRTDSAGRDRRPIGDRLGRTDVGRQSGGDTTVRSGGPGGSVDRAPISRPLDRSGRSTVDRGTADRTSRSIARGPTNRGGETADLRNLRRSADISRSLSGPRSGLRSGSDAVRRVTRSGDSLSRGFRRDGVSRVGRDSLGSRDVHVVRSGQRSIWWGDSFHGGHRGHGDWHGGAKHWGHGHWNGHRPWGRWHHGWYHGWHVHHGYWFHDYGWHYWPYRHWSFSLSFGYYSSPAIVDYGFISVYPAYWYYPPVVAYYSVYAWPVYYQPVVFSPIVTPVYTPVVVAPACYYWYPIYSYYYAGPAAFPVVYPSTGVDVSVGVSADAGSESGAVGTAESPEAPSAAAPQADSLQLGLDALRSGQIETARAHLARAVSADPSSGVAHMLYTAALVADGQYKNAALSLRDSLQVWGNVQLKDFYLPNVYADEKSHTQFTRDLREFLSDHPDRLDGWLLTIWAYAFSGQPDEALHLVGEAKKIWPDDPALLKIEAIVQTG